MQGRALLRGEAMYSPPSTAEGLSQAFFGGLRETGGFLWVGLLVALTALVGFLVAIPVFMMAFLRISAGRKLLQSALFALVGTAIVYCVFVWILDYRLYPGALFGG